MYDRIVRPITFRREDIKLVKLVNVVFYVLAEIASELGSSNSVYHCGRLESHGFLLISHHKNIVTSLF